MGTHLLVFEQWRELIHPQPLAPRHSLALHNRGIPVLRLERIIWLGLCHCCCLHTTRTGLEAEGTGVWWAGGPPRDYPVGGWVAVCKQPCHVCDSWACYIIIGRRMPHLFRFSWVLHSLTGDGERSVLCAGSVRGSRGCGCTDLPFVS